MRSYTLNAFIIKRHNYGEADKIVTIFAKELGKQTLIAKGIRKITSRRAGCLELFNQVSLLAAKSRGSMDVITETQLLRTYHRFSSNYLKTQIAYQLIEMVDKLTVENQEHDELYDLIEKAFEYLHTTEIDYGKANKVLVRFKARILELLGFGRPQSTDVDQLRQHIESIIERQLVAGRSFEL